jgi:MoaA/NifB/PqqE/SkfB family radical SAM enzyme
MKECPVGCEAAPLNLTLLLTYRCNLLCRHCISDCGPARTEGMTFDQAVEYIDRAVEAIDVDVVGYTGGEPFLRYPLLRRLMDYAHGKYGIAQGVVTNGSWAIRPELARRRLAELHKCGLRALTLSCDGFHLEWMPVERLRYVLQAAMELGLAVTVNTTVTRSTRVSKTDAPALLQVPPERAGKDVLFKEFGPLMIGRARDQIPRESLIGSRDESWFDGLCPFVTRTPTIAPDGSVFACCCFGDAEKDPERQVGYAGNANREPLGELLRRMNGSVLFRLFAERGPWAVMQLVRRQDSGLPILGRYLSNCEVCVELYHNPEIRRVLQSTLESLTLVAEN